MSDTHTGRCLCGDVKYTAAGPPVIVAQCHCEECRQLSGTGHTVGAMFPVMAVDMRGKFNEFRYTSNQGSVVTRASCAKCGSPIYGTNTRTPDHMTVTLGAMDDTTGLEVEVVIFEKEIPHWDELGKSVAKFATQPDWTPKG